MCEACGCFDHLKDKEPDLIVTDEIRRRYEKLTEQANARREPNFEILVADEDDSFFHVERDLYAKDPDEAAETFVRFYGPPEGIFGVRFKRLGGVTFYRGSKTVKVEVVTPALID